MSTPVLTQWQKAVHHQQYHQPLRWLYHSYSWHLNCQSSYTNDWVVHCAVLHCSMFSWSTEIWVYSCEHFEHHCFASAQQQSTEASGIRRRSPESERSCTWRWVQHRGLAGVKVVAAKVRGTREPPCQPMTPKTKREHRNNKNRFVSKPEMTY